LGKTSRPKKFYVTGIFMVGANHLINSVNLRVLNISIEWEAVAYFCSIHKLRNSTEAEKRVLLVTVVLVQDIANRADGLSVLILLTSEMKRSWHVLAAIAECEIYRTHKTELEAIFEVVRKFGDIFYNTQMNCKFGNFMALGIKQRDHSFLVAREI